MTFFRSVVIGSIILGAFAPSVSLAEQSVPIVDISRGVSGQHPGASSQSSVQSGVLQPRTNTATQTADMFYQIDQLQQEVQALRGIVEEQTYQINQMREEQRDRYLDLDRRITLLNESSGTQPASQSSAQQPASQPLPTPEPTSKQQQSSAATLPDEQPVSSAAKTVNKGDEENAYKAAMNLVQNKQYSQAVNSFQQLIKDHPNGEYTGNAYYWLGEVLLVEARPEDALKAFGGLLNKYPSHRKASDAKYKQGKIYLQLGDTARGEKLLQEVIDKHAGSSAAKLAEAEMREARF